MAKSSTISTAKTPKDVAKAQESAAKAIATLGIKIVFKKPDMAKLEPMMKSSPANFVLTEDGPNIKVSVEAGSYKSVLGIHNVAAEKDLEKRVTLLRNLVKSGFGSFKKELDEAEKAAAPGLSQKQVDLMQKEIAALKKDVATLTAQREAALKLNLANVMKDKQLKSSFESHCKAEFAMENLEFLRDIDKGDDYLIKTYIDNNAPKQINISSPIVKLIKEKGDVKKHAMKEIIQLLETDNLKRFITKMSDDKRKVALAKQAELDTKMKELAKATSR